MEGFRNKLQVVDDLSESNSPLSSCCPRPARPHTATHPVCPPPPATTTLAFRRAPGIAGFFFLQPKSPRQRPGTGAAASQASERTKSPDDDLRSLRSFARNSPTPGNGAESSLRRRRSRGSASRLGTGTGQCPVDRLPGQTHRPGD